MACHKLNASDCEHDGAKPASGYVESWVRNLGYFLFLSIFATLRLSAFQLKDTKAWISSLIVLQRARLLIETLIKNTSLVVFERFEFELKNSQNQKNPVRLRTIGIPAKKFERAVWKPLPLYIKEVWGSIIHGERQICSYCELWAWIRNWTEIIIKFLTFWTIRIQKQAEILTTFQPHDLTQLREFKLTPRWKKGRYVRRNITLNNEKSQLW